MAQKTARLGLNKAERGDYVKKLLTTDFNENWDKIDNLALDSDLKAHTADESIHVVKNGSLQIGLNAEMVGGLKAADLAPASHNHDDIYYTKQEIDNRINSLSGGSGGQRTQFFYSNNFSDMSFVFDCFAVSGSCKFDIGDTAYGGLKCINQNFDMVMTWPFFHLTDYEIKFVFSFTDTNTLFSLSRIGVMFAFSPTSYYCAVYEPYINRFKVIKTDNPQWDLYNSTSYELIQNFVVENPVARTYTKSQELGGDFNGGPVYEIRVGSYFSSPIKHFSVTFCRLDRMTSDGTRLVSYDGNFADSDMYSEMGLRLAYVNGLMLHHISCRSL